MILLLMISKLIIDVKRIKGYGATDIEILPKTEIRAQSLFLALGALVRPGVNF